MPTTRLGVIVSATDPGGIGLWIDTSLPVAHLKFRTDPKATWTVLI